MNASHNRIFELSINRTFEGGRNDHGKINLNNFGYEFYVFIFLKKTILNALNKKTKILFKKILKFIITKE